ncbi:MAG: hypothetical protein OHK0053_02170 [Microscillaceae bacterium]
MKKSLILLAFLIGMQVAAWSQSADYPALMTQTLTAMQAATSPKDYQDAANRFERLAALQTDDWLPNYWAAYCYTLMSYMTEKGAEKDQFADKALAFFDKIKAARIENDETWVLRAYIAQARLSADPMNRWRTDGVMFQECLGKAKAINAQNPRIDLLQGQNLLYTPESFGGGAKNACPYLRQAEQKFGVFVPASAHHPNWGKEYIQEILSACAE